MDNIYNRAASLGIEIEPNQKRLIELQALLHETEQWRTGLQDAGQSTLAVNSLIGQIEDQIRVEEAKNK